MSGSIRFDRGADGYDRTRAISDEAMARTVELLGSELSGRGRVLEVGVGTGLLALPLHAAGIELAGLDLSRPMLAKLVEKAGGRLPFPLAVGDATWMPFSDGVFGGAYLRWVLHLISDWKGAVAEIARVVRPGGVFVVSMGGYGPQKEQIHRRFAEIVGSSADPVGLGWDAFDELDEAMASLDAAARALPPVYEEREDSLGGFVDAIEEGRWSWTWPIPERTRVRAARELRGWAQECFGSVDRPRRYGFDTVWRAYDLPGHPG